ncbi:hypothetical protein LI328DRAFT_161439 [Trichoderma asperelloides]|nr:hypothetical protein LI328DRAFT_161439 [Trichoderma asperelloides]
MRQNWPGGRRRESRPIGSAGMKTAPLRASQRSCSQIHHEALLLAARLSAGPGRLGERIWQQRRGQGVDLGARKVQGSANWAWSWRPLHHPLCWVCPLALASLLGSAQLPADRSESAERGAWPNRENVARRLRLMTCARSSGLTNDPEWYCVHQPLRNSQGTRCKRGCSWLTDSLPHVTRLVIISQAHAHKSIDG